MSGFLKEEPPHQTNDRLAITKHYLTKLSKGFQIFDLPITTRRTNKTKFFMSKALSVLRSQVSKRKKDFETVFKLQMHLYKNKNLLLKRLRTIEHFN